jgi:cell division protein FtsB
LKKSTQELEEFRNSTKSLQKELENLSRENRNLKQTIETERGKKPFLFFFIFISFFKNEEMKG